jgi:hypothetical protein
VRGNRFGHSQAGRPTLRGGCIDGGGSVKKARTNKPNVEWGWAGFRVRRRPPFFVPVPGAWLGCGGRPTGKVCFRRWLVHGVRVRGTGFGAWGSCAPHPKRWPHRTLNHVAVRRCSSTWSTVLPPFSHAEGVRGGWCLRAPARDDVESEGVKCVGPSLGRPHERCCADGHAASGHRGPGSRDAGCGPGWMVVLGWWSSGGTNLEVRPPAALVVGPVDVCFGLGPRRRQVGKPVPRRTQRSAALWDKFENLSGA